MRRTRLLARLLLVTLLCASSSFASAVAATNAEPRFHLQAIEVRGTRHASSGVVVAASLLETGRVYTESELRDAVRRVDRLPFVLAADLALERGRERGTYVLVLDVREARPFFFEVGLTANAFDEPLALDDDNLHATDLDRSNLTATATVGARAFLGRYGTLFAAAGDAGVRLGFTHYRLFGRNLFLSLGLSETICCPTDVPPLGLDPAYGAWVDRGGARRASLTLGAPFADHQALRARVALSTGDEGVRRPVLGDDARFVGGSFDYRGRTQHEVQLAWLYDTTDDPLFPFAGSSLVVALDARSLDADVVGAAPSAMHSDLVRLSVLGRRHWPVADRHAFAAGLSLAAGRSEVENLPGERRGGAFDVWELGATFRHTMRLHEAKTAPAFRKLYWVSELRVSVQDTSSGFGPAYDPLEVAVVSSSVVWRSDWGTVRVGVRWVDVGDVL
jgi:hypothetical protein